MEVGVAGVVRLSRNSLQHVSAEAASSPRLRRNRNLHAMEDPVHRLFNAIEPGSYIRPHRHLRPPKTETMVVVAGRLGFLSFRDDGSVAERFVLDAAGETFGVDVPAGRLAHVRVARPGDGGLRGQTRALRAAGRRRHGRPGLRPKATRRQGGSRPGGATRLLSRRSPDS